MSFRSLHALLREIVDYAGLFPPAKLDLDPAFRNYARYRGEPEAWMLGRFVCPADVLAKLDAYRAALIAAGPPFGFAVLARGGADAPAATAAGTADISAAAEFERRHTGAVRVDAFEIKLPGDFAESDAGARKTHLDRLASAAADAGLGDRALFFEPVAGADSETGLQSVCGALAACNASAAASSNTTAPRFGFKLRTGGLDAAAFPSSARLAAVLLACREAGVPLKFTAGLHHPVRRHDAGVRAIMHGFVNVFTAAVLGYALQLDLHDLIAILDEEDPANFRFDDESAAWNDAEATIGEIEHARRCVAVSFGSCSFDEPRDDLRGLGWL